MEPVCVNHGESLSSEEALLIAGHALAVASAASMGKQLPKDWNKVHKSMPRQMHKWYETIISSELVTTSNNNPMFDIIWLEK